LRFRVVSALALWAEFWFTAQRVATPQIISEFFGSISSVLGRLPPNQSMKLTAGSPVVLLSTTFALSLLRCPLPPAAAYLFLVRRLCSGRCRSCPTDFADLAVPSVVPMHRKRLTIDAFSAVLRGFAQLGSASFPCSRLSQISGSLRGEWRRLRSFRSFSVPRPACCDVRPLTRRCSRRRAALSPRFPL
jgi:hypothetical protein